MMMNANWRTSLFDRFMPNQDGDLSDTDKSALARQGLLHLGLGILSSKGQGFGGALSQGLQGGLLAMNQGAEQVQDRRYMADVRARMQAKEKAEAEALALRQGVYGPNGLDESKWGAWAAVDPTGAADFRSKVEPKQKWQVASITDPSNPANVMDVLHDGAGNFRYPDMQPVFGGQPKAPDNGPRPLDPRQDFPALSGAFPGVQTTSLYRSPEKNADVGGVPNSYHVRGQAGDFVVPAESRPAFISQAGDMGYEAVDEGDHIHVEPRSGSQVASSFAPGAAPQPASRFSRPRFKEGQGGNKPAIERRIELAREMGASDDEIRRMVVGGGSSKAGEGADPAANATGEMQMRKEVADVLKDQNIIVNAYRKVEQAAMQPSAANDLALIFGYMKMLDPNSVVRETEFANAQNAAGVPDRIINLWNRAKAGERLNERQRAEFIASAYQLHDQAQTQIGAVTKRYGAMAQQYGFDPFRATGYQFSNVTSGPVQPQGMAGQGPTAADAAATLPPLAGPTGGLRENAAGHPQADRPQGNAPRYTQAQALDLLREARNAVMAGKDKEAVRKRLIDMGLPNIAGEL